MIKLFLFLISCESHCCRLLTTFKLDSCFAVNHLYVEMDDVARAPMIMSVLSYVDLEREPLLLCQRSIDRINLYFLRLISNENPFLCRVRGPLIRINLIIFQ